MIEFFNKFDDFRSSNGFCFNGYTDYIQGHYRIFYSNNEIYQ